jgi:hypothetical protein
MRSWSSPLGAGTCALIRTRRQLASVGTNTSDCSCLPSAALAGNSAIRNVRIGLRSLHIVDSILGVGCDQVHRIPMGRRHAASVDFMPMLRRIQDAGRCLAINER